MAIAIRGSATTQNTDTGATTRTVTPFTNATGLTAGDLAITVMAADTTSNGPTTFSGWTHLHETGNASPQHSVSFWYRIVQSGDTTASTFTFDPQGTPSGFTNDTVVYSGVDQDDPFVIQAGSAISIADADDALATPSLTSGGMAGQWWVAAGGCTNAADTTITVSTSSGTARPTNGIDGADASNRCVGMADSNGAIAINTAFSTTFTWALTAASGNLTTWLGILRPAVVIGSSLTIRNTAMSRAYNW